jgi:hypothetical protein
MGADTRGILCGRWRVWTGEGLDSTKVRELQWAVKVDEQADANQISNKAERSRWTAPQRGELAVEAGTVWRADSLGICSWVRNDDDVCSLNVPWDLHLE